MFIEHRIPGRSAWHSMLIAQRFAKSGIGIALARGWGITEGSIPIAGVDSL
jgi:hypothetical protein